MGKLAIDTLSARNRALYTAFITSCPSLRFLLCLCLLLWIGLAALRVCVSDVARLASPLISGAALLQAVCAGFFRSPWLYRALSCE